MKCLNTWRRRLPYEMNNLYKVARLSSGFFMSGGGGGGVDMSVGWDNTSKRHNYTTRRSPSRGRQVDLFYKNRPGRGSKSGAEMGVFASGVGEEYTTVTQVLGVTVVWARK